MEKFPDLNIFSPISHSHPLHIEGGMAGDWKRWAKVDEEYIGVSSAMYVLCLKGWDKSVGVTEEIKIAKRLGIDIYYIDPKDYGLEVDPESFSAIDKSNPKDLIGSRKVSITKFPAAALLHGAHAMGNGAAKYGSYNWRGNPVRASIYIDAAIRHLSAWFEGEEHAADSGVHHLGHALASIAIILDAQETGNLINDRPAATHVATAVLDRLNAQLKQESERK
jgi:hypothetical protein